MRAATCFSGIGAPEVGGPQFDWLWHAEIEKFPSAVMAQRHPDSVNLGDVLADDFLERAKAFGDLDLIAGGPPCQAFSVAGLRKSMDDPRGNLSLRWVQVLHAIRPRNAITENVPGWLNTPDNAFGCFLGALVGADDALRSPLDGKWPGEGMVEGPRARAAWRILDAQYFGVAQRRRRVFVVADFGDGADPAEILFERQGVQGNPAPIREAGEESASRFGFGAVGSVSGGYGAKLGTDESCQGSCIPWPADVCPTLDTYYADKMGLEDQHVFNQKGGKFVPGVAHALRGEGFDASEGGTGRGTPIVPVDVVNGNSTPETARETDIAQPLMAGGPMTGNQGGDFIAFDAQACGDTAHAVGPTAGALHGGGKHGGRAAVAFADTYNGQVTGDVAATLGTQNGAGNSGPSALLGSAVRRLTPTECERLQGFPEMQKTATFVVCSDHQSSDALAAPKCLKSQSNASPVGGEKSSPSANAAEVCSSISPPSLDRLAVVDVQIDLERSAVQLRSAEKSFSLASNAESKSASRLPIPTEDFVRLAALLTLNLARGVHDGKAASQASINPSILPENGSDIVSVCGDEIAAAVKDAGSDISGAIRSIMSTISERGPTSPICASTSKTLCCFVAHAIAGFIPEITNGASSYAVRLTTSEGYTAIEYRGKEAADGPRYKALGNSWAVPCGAWIIGRIADALARIDAKRAAA